MPNCYLWVQAGRNMSRTAKVSRVHKCLMNGYQLNWASLGFFAEKKPIFLVTNAYIVNYYNMQPSSVLLGGKSLSSLFIG